MITQKPIDGGHGPRKHRDPQRTACLGHSLGFRARILLVFSGESLKTSFIGNTNHEKIL